MRSLHLIQERLEKAFALTSDLYNSLEQDNLQSKIIDLPSNTIGEQVWCIIGARESYLNAIKQSEWTGFECSLKDHHNISDVLNLLDSTWEEIIQYLNENQKPWSQNQFVFDLLEHEIQHHGQLIRYFYANKLKFPESWNIRYTV
jgi:hypothetical protein